MLGVLECDVSIGTYQDDVTVGRAARRVHEGLVRVHVGIRREAGIEGEPEETPLPRRVRARQRDERVREGYTVLDDSDTPGVPFIVENSAVGCETEGNGDV